MTSASRTLGWFCAAALLLVLGGCTAQRAYWDAEVLRDTGREGAALDKFEQAWRADPRSAEYRKAYLEQRERVIATGLAQAEAAVQAGDAATAERLFRDVLAASPNQARALAGLKDVERMQRWKRWMAEGQAALQNNDLELAARRARAILQEQPSHAEAKQLLGRTEEAQALSAPEASLANIYRKPVTLEFRDAPLRSVFDALSRSSGLNFVFDRDLRLDGRVTLFLRNTTVEAALGVVYAAQQLDAKVLNGNSVFVYANNPAKQKEHQPLRVRSYYLANADVKTLAATLKALGRAKEVATDEKLNLLIVRDTADALRTIDKLVALHDVPEAEVMLEVEVLEVKRSKLVDLGVRWPDQLTLTPLSATGGTALTLTDLRGLNSGRIGAAVGGIGVGVNQTDADVNILANPRIRARNREKAKILIGERVPNITTTATSTGFLSESINYVDVGLKLDVEPTIYADGEVAIRMQLEVSNLIGQLQTKAGSLAYQIGTRSAQTVLRLKDGENQILAGLINDEERNGANKVPVLGAVPLLGRLFGRHSDTVVKTEIVLSITPRLVRLPAKPAAALLDFEAGTEGNPAGKALVVTPQAAPGAPAMASGADAPIAMPAAAPTSAGPASRAGAEPSPGAMPSPGLTWQAPATVRPGEEFTAALNLQALGSLKAGAAVLLADPSQLTLLELSDGGYFSQDGTPSKFSTAEEAPGRVRWALQSEGRGAAGSGPLLLVRLKATGTARGEVQLTPQGEGFVATDGRAVPVPTWPVLRVQVKP